VVAQARRAGAGQAQIALRGALGGTAKSRIRWEFHVGGKSHALIVGDSHLAWRSHQDVTTHDSFERLFLTLSSNPGNGRKLTIDGEQRESVETSFSDTDGVTLSEVCCSHNRRRGLICKSVAAQPSLFIWTTISL
jgi:hypothetical protein